MAFGWDDLLILGASAASAYGAAQGTPSQAESGVPDVLKRSMETKMRWLRRRQAKATQEHGRRMLENAILGRDNLVGLTQSGLPSRIDMVNQGYGSAGSRLQGGLQASLDVFRGTGDPDLSFLEPREFTPDIDYLLDYEPADYDTSMPKEWRPTQEMRDQLAADMNEMSVEAYLAAGGADGMDFYLKQEASDADQDYTLLKEAYAADMTYDEYVASEIAKGGERGAYVEWVASETAENADNFLDDVADFGNKWVDTWVNYSTPYSLGREIVDTVD